MQFSHHIDKGFWTVADKGLTVLFGLYFMKLAVTHLPATEFGLFTLVYQSFFLLVVNFTASFALQPMLKYAAESDDIRTTMTTGLLMHIGFFSVVMIVLMAFQPLLIAWTASAASEAAVLSGLFRLLPLLAVAFFIRNHVLYILQAKYHLIRLFLINLVYFITAIGLLHWQIAEHTLNNAADLMHINIVAYAISSAVALLLTLSYWQLTLTGFRRKCREMFDFGKYSLLSALTNNIYEQTDNYIIITLLSPRELGIYAVAKTLMRAYLVFSQVVQALLIPVLSRQYARKATEMIQTICEKAICFSTIALLPMGLAFLFFGPWLISLLTQQAEYAEAGPIIQISAALAIFVPWNAVFGCAYIAAARMVYAAWVNLMTILMNVVFSFFLISWLGLYGVIFALILVHWLTAVINAFVLKKTGIMDLSLLRVFGRIKDIKNFIAQRTLE